MRNNELREKIIETARARCGHYGFNKITMVTIDKNSDMFAAITQKKQD